MVTGGRADQAWAFSLPLVFHRKLSKASQAPSSWFRLNSQRGNIAQLDSGSPCVVMFHFLSLVSLWRRIEQRQSSHLSK